MIPALLSSAPRIGALCARALQVAKRTFPTLVLGDTLLDGGDLEPVHMLLPLQFLVLVLDHVLACGVPQTRVVGSRGGISVDVHLSEDARCVRERVPCQLPPIRVRCKALFFA